MSENITNNPSVPTQVVAEVKFPQFINNLGIIPTSYKDSMDYYENLAWLCKYLEETVIPTVNQNGGAVEELQALYVQLNSYVSNYFDNLDVQEEINEKLDDMVEQGTLQEIIGDYLNSKAIFGFDNVEAMKDATNLIDGSYAQTLGYYNINDGGGALYYITDDETTLYYELLDSGLKAVLINNGTINAKAMGLKAGDNTFDNSVIFLTILNYANKKYNVHIPTGKYYFTTPISIGALADFNIIGDGNKSDTNNSGTQLIYNGTGYFLTFNSMVRVNIENISFFGNNNSFLYVLLYTVSYTRNCSFNNFINTIHIVNRSGYTKYIDCVFNANSSTTSIIWLGVEAQTTSDQNIEYVYFERCSFEGQNATSSANAFLIHYSQFMYVTECDICNWSGTAIKFSNSYNQRTSNNTFKNNSYCRNGIHISMETNGNCGFNIFDGNFTRRTTVNANDRIAIIRGSSTSYNNSCLFSGMTENYYSSNATYSFELQYTNDFVSTLQGQVAGWNNLGTNSNTKIKQIGVNRKYQVRQINESGKTNYNFTLSSSSQYTTAPYVSIICRNLSIPFTYSVTNVYKGALTIDLNFESNTTAYPVFEILQSEYGV